MDLVEVCYKLSARFPQSEVYGGCYLTPIAQYLFVPQRFYGVEPRRFDGGIHPEKEADTHRH